MSPTRSVTTAAILLLALPQPASANDGVFGRWGLPSETHFHVGAFDAPERLQPTRHFFRDEQLPWLHLS